MMWRQNIRSFTKRPKIISIGLILFYINIYNFKKIELMNTNKNDGGE
jgi:ATP/maltotriose-dependent transcriptional regulator MalT